MTDTGKLFFFIALLTLFTGCREDEMDDFEPTYTGPSSFSEADLAVLNNTLNLSATAIAYANPQLPQHIANGETRDLDNTPDNNRTTDMGATLGRVLFYDVNLSINNTISCASCHQQEFAFSDPDRFSTGFRGEKTKRNSMSLANNLRYYENGHFGWDEKASSLEEFALFPVKDHLEMGMPLDLLEQKLAGLDYYPILYRYAFGDTAITATRTAKALAQFVRSIFSYQSKFDEGIAQAGYPQADDGMPMLPNFTDQEKMGLDIFYNGRDGTSCKYCHETAVFAIEEARNNGLTVAYTDNGKGDVTGNPADNATFKIPSLRNIGLTAPYMHDGRFATLEEVVNHYSDNVQQHPNLHPRLSHDPSDDGPKGQTPVRMNLSQTEKDALVAFLHTLTDPTLATDEKYSDPFK